MSWLKKNERRNAYRIAVKVAVGVVAALFLLLAGGVNLLDLLIELADILT